MGRSRAVSLSIASPDALNDAVLLAKEQLFEEMLVHLGAQLVTPLNTASVEDGEIVFEPLADPASVLAVAVIDATAAHTGWPETLQRFTELLTLMERDELTVIRDYERLQAAYTTLYDLERDLNFSLTGLASSAAAESVPRRAVNTTAQLRAEFVTRNEQATMLLEDLVAEQQADSMARTLEQISNVRDRLRELLEQYRDTNDPDLLEEIQREIARLEARLQELVARLQEQVEELPYEHLNMGGPGELRGHGEHGRDGELPGSDPGPAQLRRCGWRPRDLGRAGRLGRRDDGGDGRGDAVWRQRRPQ